MKRTSASERKALRFIVRGGCYPVSPGEISVDRYKVIRKLGFGTTSTVWLAEDVFIHKSSTYRRKAMSVAIKFISAEAGSRELNILQTVHSIPSQHPARRHLPRLLDHFEHKGPNGSHCCLVLEVLGESVGMYARRKSNQLASQAFLCPVDISESTRLYA